MQIDPVKSTSREVSRKTLLSYFGGLDVRSQDNTGRNTGASN
jgi:hypothetical protein